MPAYYSATYHRKTPPLAAVRLAAVHQLPMVSWKTLRLLVDHRLYDRPLADWSAAELVTIGVDPRLAARVIERAWQLDLDRAEQQLNYLSVTIMTIHDSDYPAQLKEIASPPSVLYLRGSVEALQTPALAVVGTRQPSPHGQVITERLVGPVAQAGVIIVSGLAIGIDASAHRAALAAAGRTVAVLGTGIDLTYPPEHRSLVEEIIAGGGTIVSEFPLGSPPERHHFPQRNRVIAGLARATMLVEAGERSGALITAKFAVESNREVFAVPGSVLSPTSVGPNNWLKLGARPTTSSADLLEIYGAGQGSWLTAPARIAPANEIEATLLSLLTVEPVHIDELVEKSRLDTSIVSATLALMEVNGKVRHLGGMFYTLEAP